MTGAAHRAAPVSFRPTQEMLKMRGGACCSSIESADQKSRPRNEIGLDPRIQLDIPLP
jgi:hypothetical protein